MAKRLIYAEDVLEILDRDKAYMSDVGRIHAKNAVNEAPTVEQKKGRWDGNGNCSACGKNIYKDIDADIWSCYEPPYCPNCGADMRGEADV
jgi:ribosomal protein L37AE/L43A